MRLEPCQQKAAKQELLTHRAEQHRRNGDQDHLPPGGLDRQEINSRRQLLGVLDKPILLAGSERTPRHSRADREEGKSAE